MRFLYAALLCFITTSTLAHAEPVEGLEFKTSNGWVTFDPTALHSVKQPRCVPLRNFWCLKQATPVRWNGSSGQDAQRHARFQDPAYAARAFIRTMRTYHRTHGLRSARAIFGRYAPSDDCIGSLPRDPGTGRCPRGENQPVVYARRVAQQLGKDLNEDLGLFDKDGRLVSSVAIPLAQAVAQFELGSRWRVTDDIIKRGILLSGVDSDLTDR